MMNFAKKQTLLSNWVSLEYEGMNLLFPDGDYKMTVISANAQRYGADQYIVFICSYVWGDEKQPEVVEIYINIAGTHAVEGRKILKSIENSIGLGKLNDTKLYIDTEFTLRIKLREVNTFKFNQIEAVI